MKIAIFAGTLKQNQDGVTRVLFKQMEFFERMQVEFICVSPSFDEDSRCEKFVVPSIAFPLYPDYNLSLPLQKKILRRLKEYQPDVVYVNSPCTLGYMGIKISKKLGIPVVATYHTHFPTYLRYYKLNMFEGLVWKYIWHFYNQCDAVFVPSLSVVRNLQEKGINNCVFLSHGVDTNVFSPDKADKNWKRKLNLENKKVVLFVGRIVKEKNLDVLAEAIQILNQKRDDFHLVVAGSGPYLEEYRARIKNSTFLGHLYTEELAVTYASSDIFVFPSVTETFGNVILEAMASGLPPVVAKSFGASELINDFQNGLLAVENSAVSLAEKIEFLLDNDLFRRRLAENVYSTGLEFSWNSILNKFNDKIFEIVEMKKSGKVLPNEKEILALAENA